MAKKVEVPTKTAAAKATKASATPVKKPAAAPAKKAATPATAKAPSKTATTASSKTAGKSAPVAKKATAAKAPAPAPAAKPTKAAAKAKTTPTPTQKAPPKTMTKKADDKAVPAKSAHKSAPTPAAPAKATKAAAAPTAAPTPAKAAPAKAVAKKQAPPEALAVTMAPVRGETKEGIKYTKDFDAKFLSGQHKLLVEARESLTGQAVRLEDEANSLIDDEMGDVQFDDESGEGDTMVVERERDLFLSARARQDIEEIDAALERLQRGTYGYSVISLRPIPRERLEAIPWATELTEEKVGGIGRR